MIQYNSRTCCGFILPLFDLPSLCMLHAAKLSLSKLSTINESQCKNMMSICDYVSRQLISMNTDAAMQV